MAAAVVETGQPSKAACGKQPHSYADSNLCTDESGVQKRLKSPVESTGAVPAPGVWDTVRKAYQRISGSPEPARGEAHGYEAILQTWIDTFAASHQFYGD